MDSEKTGRLARASRHLEQAIARYNDRDTGDALPFLTLAKAFEIVVEYAWRELKFRVEDSGLFAPSPKEAVRQAATMGLISEPEKWIAIINARNDSVHDYFTVPEGDYVKLASEVLGLIKPLI